MDVTFSKIEMYFSQSVSNSPLEEEIVSVEKPNWMIVLPYLVDVPSSDVIEPELTEPLTADRILDSPTIPAVMPSLSYADLLAYDATFPSSTPTVHNHDIPPASIPKVSLENHINTNNSAIKHIPAIQNDRDMYQLLLKDTLRKPPDRYSPDNSKQEKCPIANYVSTHRLSPACEAFENQMFAITIPTKVHDAL